MPLVFHRLQKFKSPCLLLPYGNDIGKMISIELWIILRLLLIDLLVETNLSFVARYTQVKRVYIRSSFNMFLVPSLEFFWIFCLWTSVMNVSEAASTAYSWYIHM